MESGKSEEAGGTEENTNIKGGDMWKGTNQRKIKNIFINGVVWSFFPISPGDKGKYYSKDYSLYTKSV
jgi:hypothetical protein